MGWAALELSDYRSTTDFTKRKKKERERERGIRRVEKAIRHVRRPRNTRERVCSSYNWSKYITSRDQRHASVACGTVNEIHVRFDFNHRLRFSLILSFLARGGEKGKRLSLFLS